MKQIMFSIDYDEGNQDSYRGVMISIRNIEKPEQKRKEHRFNTGFPPSDFIDAHNFIYKKVKNVLTCCMSSSLDHFTMDGDKYEWYEDEDGGEWLKASKKFKKTIKYKKLKAKMLAEKI